MPRLALSLLEQGGLPSLPLMSCRSGGWGLGGPRRSTGARWATLTKTESEVWTAHHKAILRSL
eukprot:3225727-Pyramimonas_sp.AAC.1